MQRGVSIIVCCYNSSERLPETLKHLSLQVVPSHVPWEVIIINNASTDNTVEVAENEWKELGTPTSLRIVEESKAGLSFARDKGFNTAKYDYCIFCDDDNWLQKDYLRLSFEKMELDESIGVIGGYGEAEFMVKPPAWFEKNKKAFAVGPQAEYPGDITKSIGVVYGAGAVIRKNVYSLILKKGFKSFLTDRKGKELSTGHDYEICYSIALAGFKIFYDPDLRFFHFISQERLNIEYLDKLKKGVNSARPVLSLYNYNLHKPAILEKRFFWFREVLYSFVNEILKFNYRLPYTLELVKKRKEFCKALNHIKSFNVLSQSYCHDTKLTEAS